MGAKSFGTIAFILKSKGYRMKKIKLVIFDDMDGLMFETGRLAYRALFKTAEEYDFEVCQEVYYYLTGRTEQIFVKGCRNFMAVRYQRIGGEQR